MKNALWPAVHAVFNELQQLREKFSHVAAEEDTQDPLTFISNDQKKIEKLVATRKELRGRLMQLKTIMADHLSEREVYLSLFPIVVYIDEAIQTEVFQVSQQQWALLQKELFEVEDGGVLFYDSLDDALRQPETLPFILEIFYLCLNSGFKGKYADNPARIESFKQTISYRIPVSEKGDAQLEYKTPLMIHSRIASPWYYVAAVVAAMIIYAVFLVRGGMV